MPEGCARPDEAKHDSRTLRLLLTLGKLIVQTLLLARIGVLPHLQGVERHVSMEACLLIEGRNR